MRLAIDICQIIFQALTINVDGEKRGADGEFARCGDDGKGTWGEEGGFLAGEESVEGVDEGAGGSGWGLSVGDEWVG